MERNQIIGFILLMGLFFAWMYTTAPTEEQIARQQFVRDSIEQVQLAQKEFEEGGSQPMTQTAAAVSPNDSVAVSQLNAQHGAVGQMMAGTESIESISNDVFTIDFSTKGGRIVGTTLSQHDKVTLDENREEVKEELLLGNEKSRFEYIFNSKQGTKISTADLIFKATKSDNSIRFESVGAGGSKIEQIYTLSPGSYTVDYQLKINGANQILDPGSDKIRFRWHEYLNKIELNQTFEQFYSTIYFKPDDDNSDYCNCRGDDVEEDEDEKIEWMAHTNQFFNMSIMPQGQTFSNTYFETKTLGEDSEYMKLTKGEGDLALQGGTNENFNFKMYLGPNEFNTLKSFDNGLDEIIPFGRSIFGSINRYIIRPSFNFLSKYIGSKGVVIIVMIFILKMLLYPFMYKMLYSQAKMGALKPKLSGLKDKYKDDAQRIQMETMKIYREYGVSPLGGCMPMVLQMPIWYALFRFFPASITFRQEPFLWATDLSSFDVIGWLPFEIPMFGQHLSLFTILWAISTVAYTYYNTKHMDMSANPAMKYVQYFMPIMFLVFFNNYAAGLTCYMFFSNLFNILQTVITKKFVFDDDKIRAELEVEKAKPKKKKSGFQERLEEAMKAQQEIQKQREKKK